MITEDSDRISKEVVDFFENLWRRNEAGQTSLQAELLELIPPLVSRDDNNMLEEPVSMKEVKSAIFWSGFTLGRRIVDEVIVAHEAIHMAMKSRQRRMILKLDIQKAYDRVDRSFLVVVLARFKFCKAWIKWISSMIMQFSASVLVNGSPQGFFSTSWGIQQGDPISPFLFILLAEVLGQSIAHKRFQGMWKGIEIARGVDSTTHS
ncbi:uncharacterized protein LOC131858376 [Cryptomeria japonica]|uniref:uncharacterized protein LOC131858376 n=1 Tax=Cryptomeria japonica TaxID=3369 RepID=UPI0027DA2438|nr:uncharacterized protein LOC131858376 [Cryptomeria japonica]